MYVTNEEVYTRYAILRTWGLGPTDVSSDLIYYAEAELNGLLSPVFTVPFSGAPYTPPTVKDLTIELVYCKAFFQKDPKQWKERHDAVLARIQAIKDGKEYIYTSSGTVLPPSGEGVVWSTTMGYEPVHSMLGDDEDRVDPDLLADLRSKRGDF